jgi:hypothetical protein
MCWLKQFMPLFTTICRSQEVSQVGNQTVLRENQEGALQNVTGNLSDDSHGFLTILDNVLTVGGSARGEERSRRPQPQSAGLPKGAGGDTKNGAPANVAEAVRHCEKHIDMAGSYVKKAKNKRGSIFNCLIFIEVFRELSKHTSYNI